MRQVGLFIVCFFLASFPIWSDEPHAGGTSPTPPPARPIPGITAADAHPNGCVDCHINMPNIAVDARLSTSIRRWADTVDPKLLAKAQGTMAAGTTLKGKHPSVASLLKDIPAACITCHTPRSKVAPPFSRLMHVIHLTGGDENHFMTLFQGECTHCHKLNINTGEWSVPSGPEK